MDLEYGEQYESFRAGVRSFLRTYADTRPRGHIYSMAAEERIAWMQLLIDHGYWARTIPRDYGGYGGYGMGYGGYGGYGRSRKHHGA